MGGGNPVEAVVETVVSPVASVISPVVSPVASVISPVASPVVDTVVDTVVAPVVAIVAPPPAPKPCEGSWSQYGACSASCDGGTQTRTWTTTKNPKHGGTACPSPTTQSRACNTQSCPVDCEGGWSDYGACDVTCGGGTQTRTWTTTTPSAHGGAACPSPTTQSQECNTDPCPVDCVGTWSDYKPCNVPCGGGTQTRSWTTITPPAHGGTACPSPTMELRECNTEACPTSAGPSAGPSTDSSDNDTKIYIAFGSILSVCCCMLIMILLLSAGGKPPPRGRFRR
jgi:hypothetical protein